MKLLPSFTRVFLSASLLASAASLAAQRPAPTPYEKDCATIARQKGRDQQRFKQFLDLDWKHEMIESPEAATYVGYPGQNDRWSDFSFESIERRKRELEATATVLKSIDRRQLKPADRTSYELFLHSLEEQLTARKFPSELIPVSQMDGVQKNLADTLEAMSTATLKDYEDRLARLKGIPKVLDQTTSLLKEGLKRGVTYPKISLQGVPGQIAQQITDEIIADPLKSPMLAAFKKFSTSIPAPDQERLKNEASAIMTAQVLPALKSFYQFFTQTYLPGCRDSVSWSSMPDGLAWYAHKARHHTTTDLTPQQIHDIGLSEVKRIRKEMDEVIASTGHKKSFEEFSAFLRTDKQFFLKSSEELITRYRDIAKRIDAELPKLFGKLPRLPYGVVPVPEYAAPSQPTAYYQGGAASAGRAGLFFANTYKVETRPTWEMEALTAHEAVPGHHLQVAIAQELENVPEFRRHIGYTAYVEGWGLYAESLGREVGLYKDPYSRFGQLTYEIWRAIRLVVDTGIHALGWNRQQAIDYFKQNSSRSEHDIEVEVDRYIVMPGQALAYKIGELKIKELRARSTQKLGAKFDIRAFHDRILENGALPLGVLEKQINAWIEK